MKNNRFYRCLGIAAVAAGLGLSGLIQAQPCAMDGSEHESMGSKAGHGEHPGGFGGAKHMGMFGRILHQLDLTDEQKHEVKSITQAAAPQFKALGEQMRALRHSDMATLPENGFDEAQAMASAQAHADVMKKMMILGARVKADIVALLTPEQRVQVREKQSTMQNKIQKKQGGHSAAEG